MNSSYFYEVKVYKNEMLIMNYILMTLLNETLTEMLIMNYILTSRVLRKMEPII